MLRASLLICAAAIFASCARIPDPTTYEYTKQPKMQAAYHWDVLASDVANRINNELIINDYLDTPVYVRATCGDEDTPCDPHETSTFNEAFRDLMITELVRFGVPVQRDYNDEAIVVHYKVQLVYHNAKRLRTIQPGLLTSLATGIMVFRNAPHQLRTIATAGMIDIMNQNALMGSKHEILVTTSMVAQQRYLFRTSDIYYINDSDFSHYQENSLRMSSIPLTGPKPMGSQSRNSEQMETVPQQPVAPEMVPSQPPIPTEDKKEI